MLRQQQQQDQDESRSQLAPGEKPWYYFDGNTNSSQCNNQNALAPSQIASHAEPAKQDNATGIPSNPALSLSGTDREGVVDLYSTSNVNTPNRKSNRNLGALKLSNDGDDAAVNGEIDEANGAGGRITLRSVHLSSTERMKSGDTKDLDIARVIHQDDSEQTKNQSRPEMLLNNDEEGDG